MANRGRKPRNVLTKAQEQEIINAYVEKTSAAVELQEMYGIPEGSFYRLLRKNNIPLNHPRNGKVVIRKIDPEELEVPQTKMAVVVDNQNLVQAATREVRRLDTWEVKYQGTVLVQADDVEEAVREARKLPAVKRINSVVRRS
jgi:hypothetical protein